MHHLDTFLHLLINRGGCLNKKSTDMEILIIKIMNKKFKNLSILMPLLTVMALLFVSCSDNDMIEPVEPVVISDPALKIEFQSATNGHDWTNLQTGDVVTFSYTIENVDSIDNTYKIAPNGSNAIFHQIQNTDFDLVEIRYTYLLGQTWVYYATIAAVDSLNSTGTFLLRILKPGNFHLGFVLTKTENGVKTPIAVFDNVLFNAVRIVAYRYDYMIDDGGLFEHATYNHCHKLYMDTGNQQYDNQYLGGLNYTLNFKNSRNQNQSFNPAFTNFIQKVNIDFYPMQSHKSDKSPGVEVNTIDKITFTKIINGNTSYIEYRNITVTNKGGQNAWGPEGNPTP